jgi:hypothetical protein
MKFVFLFLLLFKNIVGYTQSITFLPCKDIQRSEKYHKSAIESIKTWESKDQTTIDNYLKNRISNIDTPQFMPICRMFLQRKFDSNETAYSVVCTLPEKMLMIPNKLSNKVFLYDILSKKASLASAQISNHFISLASKLTTTNNASFYHFLASEQYSDFFAILTTEKGKHEVYYQAQKFDSLQDFIEYKYGSIEKLAELLEDEKKPIPVCSWNIKDTTDAINFFKQDWATRQKYIPEDSLSYITSFCADVAKYARLNLQQVRLLKESIAWGHQLMKGFESTCFEFPHFEVNKKDMSYFVAKVLTKRQYDECKIGFLGNNLCRKHAGGLIRSTVSSSDYKTESLNYNEKLKQIYVGKW